MRSSLAIVDGECPQRIRALEVFRVARLECYTIRPQRSLVLLEYWRRFFRPRFGLGLGCAGSDGGEGAAFAVVAGDVVFAEEADGEAFGASDRAHLFGGQTGDYSEPADVGQMLLKVVFRFAFHARSPSTTGHGSIGWPRPLALELVTFSKNRNSTIVKDAGD